MSSISIADALFTKTQQRVLALLYGTPDKSFYTNEIVRWAGMGRGTIGRELERLVSAGLLNLSRAGNQNHYRANPSNPVYSELLGIVRKSFGVVDLIRAVLEPVDEQIDYAFIYGSLAKGEESAGSDIDLLVVSDTLAYADLMALLSGVQVQLGREVNPSIYTQAQVDQRLDEQNVFMTRVMEQPKLWIKGGDDGAGATR